MTRPDARHAQREPLWAPPPWWVWAIALGGLVVVLVLGEVTR